jgi:hypothetical protein
LIEQDSLKEFIKYALKENNALVNFEVGDNPGCNEKYKKQIALCLLRNLEVMKRNNVEIRDDWIKPENLTFRIPIRILESLGIPKIFERRPTLHQN